MKNREAYINGRGQAVDPKQMIALEEELILLKKEHGILEKETWWKRLGDGIVNRIDHESRTIDKKQYIRLALSCGWLCGAHRFYVGHKVSGILYLLFFWTGIPFAMTLIDLMIVLPMQQDETGMIKM